MLDDAVGRGGTFRHLVLAGIIESVSKPDSIWVVEEAGYYGAFPPHQ
jgi:hypothetical protein